MLLPKKVKHRKWQKGTIKGKSSRKTELAFGQHGLRALTGSWVSSRQIESARRAMTRYVQRGGKIWIRIFPDKPITKKGNEVPMGGGKGAVESYVAIVKPGTIMFEIGGIAPSVAKEAMTRAAYKLPVKTMFISKEA